MRVWVLVALPCIFVGTIVFLVARGYFQAQPQQPAMADTKAVAPAPAPVPKMDEAAIPQTEVELGEIRVDRGPTVVLSGKIKNITDRRLRQVEVVFMITDVRGSQVAAVPVEVANLDAKGTAEFRVPLKQREAYNALLREIHTF